MGEGEGLRAETEGLIGEGEELSKKSGGYKGDV
jgi:hypothetical protein